jgi:chorismate mutase-like protein
MDLNLIRKKLNEIDSKIIDLLSERQSYMPAVGKYKQKNGLAITQAKREKEILDSLTKSAKKNKINPELVRKIFKLIIKDAKVIQRKFLKK